MLDQSLIWNATYKWLDDHKCIVTIYNLYTCEYKIVMEHDMGYYTISACKYIPEDKWFEIELDAFKFRELIMQLYDMIRQKKGEGKHDKLEK